MYLYSRDTIVYMNNHYEEFCTSITKSVLILLFVGPQVHVRASRYEVDSSDAE